MPISQYLYAALQEQANTADTQAQTQQRIMSILQAKKQMQEQDATRDILSKISPQAEAAGTQAKDQAADDPLTAMQGSVQKFRQDATQYRTVAAKLRSGGGDLTVADTFEKRALESEKEARALSMEAMKEQKQRTSDLGALAGSVRDEESLAAALPEIRKLNPTFGTKGNFDRDATGELTWGPKTAATMKAMDNASKTAADRTRESIAQQASLDRQDALEERKVADQARIEHLNALTAQTRAMSELNTDALRAQIEKYNAEIRDIQERTKQRQAKVDTAKAKALRPATAEEKRTADDAIATHEAFLDPETNKAKPWDPGSRDAFRSAVANRAKQVYAEHLAEDPNYSMDDAYVEAVDRLRPFVVEENKNPRLAKIPGGYFGEKQLVYRRGSSDEGAVRSSDKPTKAAPGVTESVAPKTADDYLKSIGIK
jgi:hypothetical protein